MREQEVSDRQVASACHAAACPDGGERADEGTSTPYPLSVQRVVDMIDHAPAGDLSLARLADVAGRRTLQRSFRTHVGVSPREYVQLVRLGRAHEDLVAGTGATVAEIAFRWGFTHMSRFAGAYLERYGEPPSAVLRRARIGQGNTAGTSRRDPS
jgi:transcriptional regulator GlxA family with amidase domain